MRRLILALFILAACVAPERIEAQGADCAHGSSVTLVPFAWETVTVSTTAIGFTTATWRPSDGGGAAWEAFMTIDAADVRFTVTGAAPTSTTGHEVVDGSSLTVCQGSLMNFRAIRTASTNAQLTVTYLRPPQ